MPGGSADRKPKIQETLRNIKALFKRLRVIYEKIEENFPSSESMHSEVEVSIIFITRTKISRLMRLCYRTFWNFQSLIPYEDSEIVQFESMEIDDKRQTEAYKLAFEEHREVVEVISMNEDILDLFLTNGSPEIRLFLCFAASCSEE